MARWEVPYGSPDGALVRYVFATIVSLAALCPLGWLVLGGPRPWPAWLAVPLFVAAFVTLVWRVVLVGVWVGAAGVRVRMVHRTRTVPWSRLDRVWIAPATGYDALALWISVLDGPDVETPVWRAGPGAVHKNRTKLPQDELAALMELLRAGARRS